MTDERDPKVSRRYRELGAEEPSRELDQTILAAAHRAADKPHAPLVTPSGRHRWYFSLGAAAVIVLAVAVTYQMQQEQPDPDSVAVAPVQDAQRAPAPAEKAESVTKPAPSAVPERKLRAPAAPPPPVFVPDPKPQAPEVPRELAREAPGARSDAAGAPAPRPEPEARAPAASRATPMQAQVVETPERMLERIAQLRREGNHDEADKLLAEFRRQYPDYRLSDAMLEKVEKK